MKESSGPSYSSPIAQVRTPQSQQVIDYSLSASPAVQGHTINVGEIFRAA